MSSEFRPSKGRDRWLTPSTGGPPITGPPGQKENATQLRKPR